MSAIDIGNTINIDYSKAALPELSAAIVTLLQQCDQQRASDDVTKHALNCLIKPVAPTQDNAVIHSCNFTLPSE